MANRRGTKQDEILQFIVDFIKEYGYPPTVREIGTGVNLKSTSTVAYYLLRMEDKGLIEIDGSPRAIRVTGYEFKKVSE